MTAPLGTIKEILLPDNSRVWLKSGSSLRYAATYGTERRELELMEGEAFFSVQQDPDTTIPRYYRSATNESNGHSLQYPGLPGSASDRGLGGSWAGGPLPMSMEVLRELGKGERLAWDRNSGRVELDSLVWEPALAWQQGVLLLQSASFTELRHQLKEFYGVELAARNANIRHLQFTAKFFIRTPVRDIVATLAAVHGLQFKQEGNSITLY